MLVWKLKKGWAGLEENAKAGGWKDAEQFAYEAQVSHKQVEQMYWMSEEDDLSEVDVTGMELTTFQSISALGDKHGNHYYNVEAEGYLSASGEIYITDKMFVDRFC